MEKVKMRGSVYYQSSQLVKQIFEAGAKKEDRVNPNCKNRSNLDTSFRNTWTPKSLLFGH
jgi:hypothetical protein